MDSLAHSFLIAMPGLAGTYFGNTVIYICQHDSNGAMGLVINRLARMNARRLARRLGQDALPGALEVPIHEGGPMSAEQGFVLHTDDRAFDTSVEIATGILLSSSPDALQAALSLDKPDYSAIFFGYAGWGPGQLESELDDNAWLTAPANRHVVFEVPCELRRQHLAKTLALDLRMLAARTGHA